VPRGAMAFDTERGPGVSWRRVAAWCRAEQAGASEMIRRRRGRERGDGAELAAGERAAGRQRVTVRKDACSMWARA
jgi:hypothetical protein